MVSSNTAIDRPAFEFYLKPIDLLQSAQLRKFSKKLCKSLMQKTVVVANDLTIQ